MKRKNGEATGKETQTQALRDFIDFGSSSTCFFAGLQLQGTNNGGIGLRSTEGA